MQEETQLSDRQKIEILQYLENIISLKQGCPLTPLSFNIFINVIFNCFPLDTKPWKDLRKTLFSTARGASCGHKS